MIRSLTSSLGSFKSLWFRPGLNVILAQKSAGATDRQTRNGAGKTSFVELVHFLLGSDCGTKHFLRAEPLVRHLYAIDFDVGGASVQVARSPSDKSRLVVANGEVSSWPRRPKVDKKTGHLVIKNKDWRIVLGVLDFALPAEEPLETDTRFAPTFRSLFPYFARRQDEGGFVEPAKHAEKQQPYNQQIALSYLLGLDSRIPRELEEVRQREKALADVRKAAKNGAFGDVIPKAADLRTRLTVDDARLHRLRDQLAVFHVVPEYRQLEEEASMLTRSLSRLANDNQADRELVRRLEDSMRTETPPQYANLRQAYEEVGVALSELVRRRFEEVQRFHESIVENRRSHLQAELTAAQQRIQERDREKEKLDGRRAEVMGILQSGGALEQFTKLQGELGRLEGQTASLRRAFEAADELERNGARLEVARARLHQRLKDDHHEQRAVIEEAILTFEDLSNALYEKAGSLTVRDTPSGPRFEVTIDGARSKGINNMQIFCFDLMLMELCTRRGLGPGFLIHDSHLFDGVDARQIARALSLAAERAQKLGFQYIATMNEDAVPRAELGPTFRFDDYVLDVRLTDADDGGLFGVRFN